MFGSTATSPEFSAANMSGHIGSTGHLAPIDEATASSYHASSPLSSHPGKYGIPYPSLASPTMGSPTTASVPNAAGAGHVAGFNAEVHTANYAPSTSQSIHQQGAGLSLLTAQILQHSRALSAQEQLTQSPVAMIDAHLKTFSMGSMINPGLSPTHSAESSFHGHSLNSYLNGLLQSPTNISSPLFAEMNQFDQKPPPPTPTVAVEEYDEFGIFGGLDFNISDGTSGLPSNGSVSSPPIQPFSPPSGSDHSQMRRCDSLRAPSLSLSAVQRPHPYHRRSSTSSSASPYMPGSLSIYESGMMADTSPISPFPSSSLLSTSPIPMDIVLPSVSPQRGTTRLVGSLGATPSYGHLYSQFTQAQQASASAIIKYMMDHPNMAIPSTYITGELAEIKGTRGRCLIGSCAAAEDKMKRVDHLYDHIRDKHFECRPYACNHCHHSFSREHDLKRHSQIHDGKSMECQMCTKSYTRFDNLQRHMQQKHGQSTLSSKFSL